MFPKKSAIIIILVTIFLYIISPASILQKAFADEELANGSTIGGVNVSGLKKDEMKNMLEKEIEKWTSRPIAISGGGSEISVDPSQFQFDLEATISDYESLTDQPWFMFWAEEKVVQLPLQIAPNDELKNEIANVEVWNTDLTYDKVMLQTSYLKSHEVEAEVKDLSVLENERLALSIEQIPNGVQGLQNVLEKSHEYIINPNEPFSLLQTIGDSADLTNREGLNFVASMLYDTFLQTNYKILERHSQNQLPSYLQPGIEAEVNKAVNEDLKFLNTSNYPAVLKVTVDGSSLKIELYSSVKETEVDVQIDKEKISPRIINRYTNDLPIGQTKLIQEGREGLRVTVYRMINESGNSVEEKISRDYYPPTNRIVLNSSRQPVVSESVQTDATSVDPSLEMDLNGDGLADYDNSNEVKVDIPNSDEDVNDLIPMDEENLPPGSYYDKGGNLITP